MTPITPGKLYRCHSYRYVYDSLQDCREREADTGNLFHVALIKSKQPLIILESFESLDMLNVDGIYLRVCCTDGIGWIWVGGWSWIRPA